MSKGKGTEFGPKNIGGGFVRRILERGEFRLDW